MTPTDVGSNGRDAKGRFVRGNPGGPGRPLGTKVHELRGAILGAVGPEHMRALTIRLLKDALQGDNQAARLLLDRVLGGNEALDLLMQVESMEERVAELEVMQ